MKEITIEQLKRETERWVMEAAENGGIVITDHGRPVAALTQVVASRRQNWARQRLAKLQAMPPISADSGELISEDRDRA